MITCLYCKAEVKWPFPAGWKCFLGGEGCCPKCDELTESERKKKRKAA